MHIPMPNIILQHFDGKLRELDVFSMYNIKAYADMVGAEYELVRGKPFRKHLTAPCQKVYMLDEVYDDYDQVLMLDIDMFAPKGMTENVFDQTGVGLYGPVQQSLHRKLFNNYPMISSAQSPYWGGAIYKMDKAMRQKLRAHAGTDDSWMNNFNQPYHFEDEGIMHVYAASAGIEFTRNMILDPKWCQCSFLPNPQDAGFIHIRTKITPQGPKREKIENYQALVDQGIL